MSSFDTIEKIKEYIEQIEIENGLSYTNEDPNFKYDSSIKRQITSCKKLQKLCRKLEIELMKDIVNLIDEQIYRIDE